MFRRNLGGCGSSCGSSCGLLPFVSPCAAWLIRSYVLLPCLLPFVASCPVLVLLQLSGIRSPASLHLLSGVQLLQALCFALFPLQGVIYKAVKLSGLIWAAVALSVQLSRCVRDLFL